MGCRGIRSIGVISGIMALLALGHGFWAAFVPYSRSADEEGQPHSLTRRGKEGGMLEVQALEIAALKRRLAEPRHGDA